MAGDIEFVRHECGRVVLGIEDMMFKQVRKKFPTLDADTTEDLVQRCQISLWERSLKEFDTTRAVKLTTFIYSCIAKFLQGEARKFGVNARRREILLPPDTIAKRPAPDIDIDRRIAAIADDLQKNPEKYLTRRQAEVFRIHMANPGERVKDLANQVDYRQASSLSMMMKRIRDRLGEISIEDGPITTPIGDEE